MDERQGGKQALLKSLPEAIEQGAGRKREASSVACTVPNLMLNRRRMGLGTPVLLPSTASS